LPKIKPQNRGQTTVLPKIGAIAHQNQTLEAGWNDVGMLPSSASKHILIYGVYAAVERVLCETVV
jgi:hypothetical protein